MYIYIYIYVCVCVVVSLSLSSLSEIFFLLICVFCVCVCERPMQGQNVWKPSKRLGQNLWPSSTLGHLILPLSKVGVLPPLYTKTALQLCSSLWISLKVPWKGERSRAPTTHLTPQAAGTDSTFRPDSDDSTSKNDLLTFRFLRMGIITSDEGAQHLQVRCVWQGRGSKQGGVIRDFL